MLVSVLTFKETHEATILHQKASKLRKSTGNQGLYATFEQHTHGQSIFKDLERSFSRPLRLLLTHPIVQVISLIFAFNFGVLFFVISTFSELWTSD